MNAISLRTKPLSARVGALVEDLDLREPIGEDLANELRRVFRERHLLVIRQAGLSDDDQRRFARVFGVNGIRYARKNEGQRSDIQYVSNDRPDGILGQGEIVFHMDHMFYDPPLAAIILYGIAIPKSGSQTKFRNASSILHDVPAALVERARGVRVHHLFDYTADYNAWMDPAKAPADSPRAWQPLIWTEPGTGRESLWVSHLTTVGFEGIGEEDGFALVRELTDTAAAVEAAHVYVHDWRVGDMVIWNNRMLHHARLPFESAEPRTLRRSAIL